MKGPRSWGALCEQRNGDENLHRGCDGQKKSPRSLRRKAERPGWARSRGPGVTQRECPQLCVILGYASDSKGRKQRPVPPSVRRLGCPPCPAHSPPLMLGSFSPRQVRHHYQPVGGRGPSAKGSALCGSHGVRRQDLRVWRRERGRQGCRGPTVLRSTDQHVELYRVAHDW